MTKKSILLLLLFLTLPAVAEEPKAPPAAAKPDAAMDMYKAWVGTLSCTGVVKAMGYEMKDKSTARFSWDLDNYWLKFDFSEAKTKDKAMPNHTIAYYGYDPAAKQYTVFGVDNFGASFAATSKGMEGGKIEFAGKGKFMGMDQDYKETQTIDPKSKKTHVSGVMGPAGFPPDKSVSWELDCTR